MNLQQSTARALLEIHAVKLSPKNPFTWASGLRSPIYCDNRIILSHPKIRKLIISGIQEVAKLHFDFDGVAGVATAGIPHGALLSDRMNLPFIYVRSSAKKHGRTNVIEGDISTMSRVLVIEDLISTGGSSLEAVAQLQQENVEVAGVLAIFNYEFEVAKNNFESKQIPFLTLTNYSTLIEEAKALDYISEEDYSMLLSWSSDPKAWSSKH